MSSENVNELKSLVSQHIDKQGNGLNTFEPNLALLTSLAKNGKNSNILQSLDSIKGNSEYKNKIINMYVDNAGSFYNLAHNPSFKNLEFRDILSDAIYYTAKQNPTREVDYTHLINDIESFLNLAKDEKALKNALVLDSNKVENLTAQAFGLALAKFSRQKNPSSALYECLKEAPKALELATQPTFFTQGKALSEIDIYDFLEYLINQGQVTQSQSALSQLMPRLRELRESIANPQGSVSKVESSIDDLFKELKSKIDSLPEKQVDNALAFIDSYGVKYHIPKDTADLWLKTFDLENLEQAYIPSFTPEVKQALDSILQGEQIKLTSGSLLKLMQRDRLEFLPYIKDTLESPQVVVRQVDGALIFAKDFRDDKLGKFFASVSKNDKGEWVISSNAPKNLNNLQNKIKEGGEVLYSDLPELPIIAKPELPAKALNSEANLSDIIPQNPTKAQSEYFNPFMNEYEKIKGVKKLHTQDDNLISVMKIEGRDEYIEPLSNLGVSKEYLQKQTAQSLKEQITQAILDNQAQLKALQQGYNTQHLSPFQKEVLESTLDIANNPTKLKEYKLQVLQKQLDNLNENEAYLKTLGNYDKARYAKDREELEREIAVLKGESNDIIATESNKENTYILREQTKEILNSLVGKNITNQNDGRIAQISRKNIAKMTSDKAIQKSVDNGFTPQEHFKAVQDIENLYQGAILRETHKDFKGESDNVLIHRYNTKLDNANAHITLKETLSGQYEGNKIYTLELESLELKPTLPEPQGSETMSRNTIRKAIVTPTETPTAIIPQQTLESTMQKFNYDEKKAKNLLEWHKDSSPLTKDENGVPKVENMLESKVKMQGKRVDIEIPKEKDFFKNLRNNTKKVLSVLKGQVFENINSGMKAQVSSDGINKMISVKAVDKSINNGYTKEEHFASVENVINLYKISKLTQSEKPNNNSVDVIAYHKFIADFSINHKPTKAKITLRETFEAGNRIYSLELLELEKASN